MYAIVSFDNEKETGFIPLNWLVNPVATNNIGKLIEDRTVLQCYWPPWKNTTKVTKAIRDRIDPCTDWVKYKMRLLGLAGKYFIIVIQKLIF